MSEGLWEVPPGWAWAAFADAADIAQDLVSPADVPTLRHVAPNHIESITGRLNGVRTVAEDEVISPKQRFFVGQVLFSKIRPYLRKAAIAEYDGVCSADMYPIWPREVVDRSYLFRWLVSEDFKDEALSYQGRTLLPKINQEGLNATRIPIPPLPEQRRIVAKLDRLSARSRAARDHLARTATLAARAKQAILASEAVEPWSEQNSRRATVAEIASATFDGPFGSKLKTDDYTPDGFRVVRLENIAHLNFRMDRHSYISKSKFADLTRHTLYKDDILFSSFIDDEIRVCRLPEELSGTSINKADCFCIRVDETVCDPAFLTYRLGARETFFDLERLVHGATRPRIGLKHLKAYKIALPPLDQQHEIVRRIETAFARIDRLTAEAARAAHLLDRLDERLLAKAFRGELVPQDPADEPAAHLLARIRAARADAPKARRGWKPKGAP